MNDLVNRFMIWINLFHYINTFKIYYQHNSINRKYNILVNILKNSQHINKQ